MCCGWSNILRIFFCYTTEPPTDLASFPDSPTEPGNEATTDPPTKMRSSFFLELV